MKKFYAFLMVIFFVFTLVYVKQNDMNFYGLLKHFDYKGYYIYTSLPQNFSKNTLCVYDYRNAFAYSNKIGEEIVISGSDKEFNSIINILNINIIYKDNYCIYGYTNKINNYVIIDGKQINVQIYMSKDTIKIGTPLIMGYI